MTMTLLGLLVQRREVARKGQRRRGRSEFVQDGINYLGQKNNRRRVIKRWFGYETYKPFII